MTRSVAPFALSVLFCLSLSACSSDTGSPPAAGGRAMDRRDDGSPGRDRVEGRRGSKGDGAAADGTARASEDARTSKDRSLQQSSTRDQQPGSARSVILDPVDAEYRGDVPDYSEIRSAAVVDLGRKVEFSTTFVGSLPDRMTDRYTVMTVKTTVRLGREEIAVYAEGEADGWEAYLESKGGVGSFPAFAVDGDTIVFEVPWRQIGSRRFRWTASSAWTQGTETDTYFSFDSAPNHEPAPYPDAKDRRRPR